MNTSTNSHHPAIIKLVIAVIVIGICLLDSAPANAVDVAARTSLPVLAGSDLRIVATPSGPFYSRDVRCTAGAVLRATGLLANLTSYYRAVRYVATSAHCVTLGQKVRVGNTEVGAVSWVSTDSDLALIRIEPTTSRSQYCYPISAGHRCEIVLTYEPRAVGEVFLGRNRSGQESSIPITGTGIPSDREIYCTSGASTGINCSWTQTSPPAGIHIGPHQVTSRTSGANTGPGDSGGFVGSRSGTLYGIHSAGGGAINGQFADGESYVPIGVLLRERPTFALVTGR